MIEPPFALFKMQAKSVFRHAPEFGKARFCVAPKTLDSVDVVRSAGEFVTGVFDSEVFVVANIHKPVITPPPVGIDDAADVGFSENDALQRGFGAIRDDLGVNVSVAFEEAEYDGFAVGAAAAAPTNAFRPEVGFVHFDDPGLAGHCRTLFGDRFAQEHVITVDGMDVKPEQGRCLAGGEVCRKHFDQAAEFRFGNVRIFQYFIFHCYYKYN